jgi:hypothetical protein
MIAKKVGSIGAAWPPSYDKKNNRVKGFCPFKVDDTRLLSQLRGDIARSARSAPQASRITVRAFVKTELVDRMDVEVRLPAERVFSGFELVYIGSNSERRRALPEILRQEIDSVNGIMRDVEQLQKETALARVRAGNYEVGTLTDANPKAIRELLALYAEAYQEYLFDINQTTIMDMLDNGNIVLVARKEGTIVSSLIAEHALVDIEGTNVHLYELSDYATLRAHRGKGIITATQMMAIDEIRSLEHGAESIIYAEDRAAWIAVNRSSRRAGMTYCGTLEKHCRLVSDRSFAEQGNLENLNVWVSP